MTKIVSVPGVGKFKVPDSATDAQITYFTNQMKEAGGAREAAAAFEASQPGALGAGMSGAKEQLQTAAGKAAQGLGLESLSDYLYKAAEQTNIEASRYAPQIPTYKQIKSFGNLGTYILEQGASSLPVTAAGISGGIAGGLAGGPAGALAGGSAAVYPFLFGANLQRQAQEQNIPIEQTSGSRAALAAAAQAPLEAVVDRYFGGAIGKTLTGISRSTIRSSFGKEIVKSAIKGSSAEGLSESGQQAIEIGQANPEKLFKMGPEVQAELLNAAVAGGLLGGAMGGTFEGVGEGFAARSVNRQVDNGVKAIRAQNPQGDLIIEPVSIAPGTKSERKLFAVKDSTGKTLQTFTRKDIAEEAVKKHGVLARVLPISAPPVATAGGVKPVVPAPPTGIGAAPVTPPVVAPEPLATPTVGGLQPEPTPAIEPAAITIEPGAVEPSPTPEPVPSTPALEPIQPVEPVLGRTPVSPSEPVSFGATPSPEPEPISAITPSPGEGGVTGIGALPEPAPEPAPAAIETTAATSEPLPEPIPAVKPLANPAPIVTAATPVVNPSDRAQITPAQISAVFKKDGWQNMRNDTITSTLGSSGNLPEWFGDVRSLIDELSLSFDFKPSSSLDVTNKRKIGTYPNLLVGINSKRTNGVAWKGGTITLDERLSRESALAVAIHEFGHMLEFEKLQNAPPDVQASIELAYQKYKKSIRGKDLKPSYSKPITSFGRAGSEKIITDPAFKTYVNNKQEWFAEQVSRWVTEKRQPVSLAEKFFKNIGNMWKAIYAKVSQYAKLDMTVEQFIEGNWRPDIAERLGAVKADEGKVAPSVMPETAAEEPVISKRKKTPKKQAEVPVARSEVMPTVAPTVQEYNEELQAHANDKPVPGGTAPEYPYNVTVVPTTQADYEARAGELSYGVGAERIAKVLDVIASIPLINRLLPARLKSNTSRAATEFIMRFADKFISVGQFVDAIRKAGGTVLDAFDPYLREELMHGIVNERLIANEATLYTPLVKKLKDSGISIEDMDMYLYALHAKERNIRMTNMGNTDPDKGSGMSDEDAADIIAGVKADPKFKDYEEARAMFRKIIEDTNKTRVEAGLLPADMPMKKIVTEDGLEIDVEPYENYAPLRGFAEEDAEDTPDTFARTGLGLNIRGREDIRALGRKSRASDIIAHAMLQNTEAVIRAEKNAVGKALYDLITNNKDAAKSLGVEVITSKPLKPYLGPSGVIKVMGDPFYKTKPNVFVFKKDGKEIAIKIGNEQMARALISKPLGSPDISQKLVRTMASVNRWFANVNTGWNPEFMLTNLPRDLQTALINIGQYDIKGIEKKVFADVRKGIKASWRVIRDQSAEGEMEDWFRDFAAHGGMTAGVSGARSLEERVKIISDLVKEDKGTGSERAMKAAKAIIQTLEDANGAVENSIRLSVYKNLVQAGVSKPRAAQAAKNLTVNFDKRGEYGTVLNSLYLFFNASVQGTLSMGMALARSSKVRKTVAKIVVLGLMQDIINSIMAPEGDDGESMYDKIPDYKLKTNLIIMDPTGATKNGYFAIPLPYGFNAFFNMGRTLGRSARGKYNAGEATGSIMGTFVDAFNPVGGTETFLNFLAPTTLDPIVSLATNTDFSGKKIFPTAFGGTAPKSDSQVYWSSTSPAFVNLSDFMSKATGGGEYVPGLLEVKPDVLEFAFDYALGGVGSFIKRTFDTATNTIPAALTGDLQNLEVNNIPVFRRLVGNVSERVSTEQYMDQVNHVISRGRELEEAIKNGDPESIKSIRSNYKDELRIYGQVKQVSNQRNRLATDLKRIRENEKMPTAQKIVRSEQIQKQMERLTKQVNELYAKNIGNKWNLF